MQANNYYLGEAVAIGAATAIVAVLLLRRRRVRSKDTLPIPQTYRGWVPWLGVALPFFNDVHGFVADKLRRHGVDPFRYLLLGQMWVIISAPADVRAFLTSPEHELSIGSAFEGLVGFLMPKEFAFIRRHHIFVPALRSTAMQQFVTCWHQLLESELTHLWPSSEGGAGRVELFGACRKLIMRLIVRGLLGPGIFEECRYEEFCQAFDEIDPEKGLVDLMSCLLSPSKKEAAWLRVKAIVSSLIDRYERFGASSGGADLAGECTLHDMVRSAAAKGQGGDGVRCKLDVGEATGHLFAFLFAGLSSTYAVLAWCILHLTADDGLRSRVMAELLGKGDAASLDSYESVPVTRALVDEVIRTHPFGLLFRKVVPADGFALPSGRRVPQGDILAVYVPQLSQDPELFGDDALDFNIDRFLEPRRHHKAAGLLCVPWGAGKHPCLGARFAVVQVAMVLRALFTNFDFLPLEQLPDINQSQFATVGKPRSPVPLTFRRKPKQ